jgi:tetratricopeptide (TPR) repeat protein
MKAIGFLAAFLLSSSVLVAAEPQKTPVPDEIKKELYDLLHIYPIEMSVVGINMVAGGNESEMSKNSSIKEFETQLSAAGKDDKEKRAKLLLGIATKFANADMQNEARKFADEARGLFSELLAASPGNTSHLLYKIMSLSVAGRGGEAADELLSAIEKRPDDILDSSSMLLLVTAARKVDAGKLADLFEKFEAAFEKRKKEGKITGEFVSNYLYFRYMTLMVKKSTPEKQIEDIASLFSDENRKLIEEWVKTAKEKTHPRLFKCSFDLLGAFITMMNCAKNADELQKAKFDRVEDAIKATFEKYPAVGREFDNASADLMSLYAECAPRFTHIYELAGSAKALRGDLKEAEKIFFEGVKAAPRSEKNFLLYFAVCMKQYEKDEKTLREKLLPAADMLNAAHKDGYYTKNTLHDLGFIYYTIGKYENAAECFARALDEYRPDFDGKLAYGVALIRTGKYEEGIEELRAARKIGEKQFDRESEEDNARGILLFHNAAIGTALNGEPEKAATMLEQMIKAGATSDKTEEILKVIKKIKKQ